MDYVQCAGKASVRMMGTVMKASRLGTAEDEM